MPYLVLCRMDAVEHAAYLSRFGRRTQTQLCFVAVLESLAKLEELDGYLGSPNLSGNTATTLVVCRVSSMQKCLVAVSKEIVS